MSNNEKRISLIVVPYDSGHFNERMGAGPLSIINGGLLKKLEDSGFLVYYKVIQTQESFPTEIATTLTLIKQIKSVVSNAIEEHAFPIILSGNCNSSVGAIAGLNNENTGIIWFDAHGDCETPETTVSGFLDGMALSMITGHSWQNILSSVKENYSIPGKNVMLIGARDLSRYEEEFIRTNKIRHIPAEEIRTNLKEIVESSINSLISDEISNLHVHIDMDVLDTSIAHANSYALSGGLLKEDIIEIFKCCNNKIAVSSLTISAYDPAFDKNNRMLQTINEIIKVICEEILSK